MNPTSIIDLTQQALVMILVLSLPAVITAGIVGILAGLMQAITQIQDQSIGYAAKLIAVTFVVAIFAKWMAGELLQFGDSLFRMIPVVGHR